MTQVGKPFLSFLCVFASFLGCSVASGGASAPAPVCLFPSYASSERLELKGEWTFSPRPNESLLTAAGWSQPEEITLRDYYSDGEPDLQVDSQGIPWVIWIRREESVPGPRMIYWSTRSGDSWTVPQRVNPSDTSGVFKPKFALSPGDTAWAVWASENGNDIWFIRGFHGSWWGADRVHPPSISDYYSPEIAMGGGQVWMIWYGPSGSHPMDVYVTHWIGTGWATPTNISPSVPGYNWFADIAVDNSGTPHAVWGEYYSGRIYYSTMLSRNWSIPVAINNPSNIAAANWPAPQIEADPDGNLHMVWVGRKYLPGIGYADQDVFYSSHIGGVWSPPIQVNTDDTGDAYYPVLALRDPGQIWVVWSNNEHSLGYTVWAALFDGSTSLGQDRLDNGQFFYNELPRIYLSPDGYPWVVWDSISQGFTDDRIFCSHFLPTTSVLLSALTLSGQERGVELHWQADSYGFSEFYIERSSSELEGYRVIGSVTAIAQEVYGWLDTPPQPGKYWYRINGRTKEGSGIILGPVPITWSPLLRLVILARNPVRNALAQITIGLPVPERVSFEILDVQGRIVERPPAIELSEGWHDLGIHMGSSLGVGLFFLRARSLGETRTIKLLILH